jgi:hypothetical protein
MMTKQLKRTLTFVILMFLFGFADVIGQPRPETNILFNAFKQGDVNGGGNCASIALIKASIGTFGIGDVFDYSKSDVDSLINVKLRNGQSLKVTYAEIRKATTENGFVLKSDNEEAKRIKFYADTCFAVMVKMNQILRNLNSYSIALDKLLNGYFTPTVNCLLGIKFKELSRSDLPGYTNIVTYNSYHAVYSSYGYYDEVNSPLGYLPNSKLSRRFGYKCSWYGCVPRKGFIIE